MSRSELSMNASPMTRLQLLGSPWLGRENGIVVTGGATQRHRLALLALLALSAGRGLSREKLLTYL